MKLLKYLTIFFAVIVVLSIMLLIILTNTYANNKGIVEGTGFIKQEFFGAGSYHFDVDDYGNIYFSIINKGIVIYDKTGTYKYSLSKPSSGQLSVKIDEKNNIMIYDIRDKILSYYNSKGFLMCAEDNIDTALENELISATKERSRNNITYIRNNRTILKIEKGATLVVFKVPVWQRWYRTIKLILIFSCLGLFVRYGIFVWKKAYS